MEPEKKDIIDDLMAFTKAENYYARIGRAWQRGYLLYGPPGTRKSTTISAMTDLLGYDLYDLKLTTVKDKTELMGLLIETTSKSIIVIEDIDCSLDIAGPRRKRKYKGEEEEEKDPREKLAKQERETKTSQVNISGFLIFIDGLWSACRGGGIIVIPINHVEQLDPALVRKGRMYKHIELLYCKFEAFKVLAGNYLRLQSHDLFSTIVHCQRKLIGFQLMLQNL